MKAILFFLMMCSAGFSQTWLEDFEAAKRMAAEQQKDILLVFTGSDWCANCKDLEDKVWYSESFTAEANKRWVLLKANFPKKSGMPEPVNVNETKMVLTERYNRNGFFPYVVIIDKTGKVKGRTGYEDFETAEEYVSMLKNL